jgi:hypothetical protein
MRILIRRDKLKGLLKRNHPRRKLKSYHRLKKIDRRVELTIPKLELHLEFLIVKKVKEIHSYWILKKKIRKLNKKDQEIILDHQVEKKFKEGQEEAWHLYQTQGKEVVGREMYQLTMS